MWHTGSAKILVLETQAKGTCALTNLSLLAMFKSGAGIKSKAFIKACKADASLAADVDEATGNTALHFACCGGAPLPVVKALLAANPDAAAALDGDGNLPIVGAVSNGCDAAVVEALLEAFPDG